MVVSGSKRPASRRDKPRHALGRGRLPARQGLPLVHGGRGSRRRLADRGDRRRVPPGDAEPVRDGRGRVRGGAGGDRLRRGGPGRFHISGSGALDRTTRGGARAGVSIRIQGGPGRGRPRSDGGRRSGPAGADGALQGSNPVGVLGAALRHSVIRRHSGKDCRDRPACGIQRGRDAGGARVRAYGAGVPPVPTLHRRAFDQGDGCRPLSLPVHRAGPLEVDLQQDWGSQPGRARGPGFPGALCPPGGRRWQSPRAGLP